MPLRLRPKAPVATDAILAGDPARAMLLAQELLEAPRMSNHARGLWGYSGRTPAGDELTVQATGMGGPSAAAVLSDLAELGVRRAVRIGTCAGLDEQARAGELLLVAEAVGGGGSATSFGVATGEALRPDPRLFERLREALAGQARAARVVSFDTMPADVPAAAAGKAAAGDMQTAATLALGPQLGIAAAAVLIVTGAGAGSEQLAEEALEDAAKRAGRAASSVLSS